MDAICLGELLIDFVCPDPDVSLSDASRFTRAAGGAPANVAVGLARMGLATGFIGCVGSDPFGEHLVEVVGGAGVDVSRLVRTTAARTTLAFVATRGDGRKDITFYRHPGADAMLRESDLDFAYLASTRLFHFCSVSLSKEPSRTATLTAARAARQAGAIVSFDPNWRAPLWDREADGRRWIREGLTLAEVVKVADEELEVVCDTSDPDRAIDTLLAGGARLAVITFGPAGSRAGTAAGRAQAPGLAVDSVDPLGAGDAFVAALLAKLLEAGTPELGAAQLPGVLEFANAAGALATQNIGVIPSLPTRSAVEQFLADRR